MATSPLTLPAPAATSLKRPGSASPHMLRLALAKAMAGLSPPGSPTDGFSPAFPSVSAPGGGTPGGGRGTSSPVTVGQSRSPSRHLTMVDRAASRGDTAAARARRADLRAITSGVNAVALNPRPLSASPRARSPGPRPAAFPPLTIQDAANSASPVPASPVSPLGPELALKPSKSYREIGHLPGYTGHVSGYDHVAGRPFGKATKRAMARDSAGHMMGDGIPSPPHSNPKIPSNDVVAGHIPGYAGHVPHYKDKFGSSFTSLTADCPHTDLAKYGGTRAKANRKAVYSKTLNPSAGGVQ